MPTNYILQAFARPDKNPDQAQPLAFFNQTPVVLPIGMAPCKVTLPGPNGIPVCQEDNPTRFRAWVNEFRNPQTGRAIPNVLKRLGARPDGGKLALVGFSAGGAALSELLQHPADRDDVDIVFADDSLHLQKNQDGSAVASSIQPWTAYGAQALDGHKLLVLLHTAVATPNPSVMSTTESSKALLDALRPSAELVTPVAQVIDPQELMRGPPPPGVTIIGQSGDQTRVYDTMPTMTPTNLGNVWSVAMPGNRPGDHIFASIFGQAAIFRTFIIPRWNAPSTCTVAAATITAAPKNVILYTLPGCPPCKTAKAWLNQKGIAFLEKDATANFDELKKKSGTTQTPTFDINGQIIVGFDVPKVENALGLCKAPGVDQKKLDADTDLDPRNSNTPPPPIVVPSSPDPLLLLALAGVLYGGYRIIRDR